MLPFSASRRFARPAPDQLRHLAGEIQRQLQQSAYVALRTLRCHVQDESLVLEGRVGSYYLKQLASAVAQRVAEGCAIDNRLEVVAGASIFWQEKEEPAIDPLSGRRRHWSAGGAGPSETPVEAVSQSA